MNDKREMIERALRSIFQIFNDPENQPPQWDSIYDALAEQIVIECEVEHGRLEDPYKPQRDRDVTWIHGGEDLTWRLRYEGTLGETPGKALAIILPLKND